MPDTVACLTCWADVQLALLEAHEQWHEDQRMVSATNAELITAQRKRIDALVQGGGVADGNAVTSGFSEAGGAGHPSEACSLSPRAECAQNGPHGAGLHIASCPDAPAPFTVPAELLEPDRVQPRDVVQEALRPHTSGCAGVDGGRALGCWCVRDGG